MHTPDLTAQNIERVSELFPSCVVETRDEKGGLRRSIDFDQLRQELSSHIVEGPRERYHLDWPGKREALLAANAPIAKTLRPCREESIDFDTTKNLFIEGDNLDALKILQEPYLGKVRVIFIDPPYNVDGDFVYDDNFGISAEEYFEKSRQINDAGERMIANMESSGRFHSKWLSMMYCRLKIARNLLADDGVIFISIDDKECGQLFQICDEIFGDKNFVGLFARRTKSGGGSASESCAIEHDYILAFTNNSDALKPLTTEFQEKYLERYKESDENGPYFWDTMERSSTGTKPYLIEAPDGTMLKGKWFRGEARFKEDLKKGEVRIIKVSDGWSVQFKQRLSDGKKLRSILNEEDLTDKKYRSLSEELEKIIGCSLGHPPKPVELLKTLIFSKSNNPDREDIILDFFAGSSTTAQAVMELNAKDGGKRRHIMVQIPEVIAADHQAVKLGFENVSELSKERIRRAGKDIKESSRTTAPNLDVGFRVLKIDTTNMQEVYYAPNAVKQGDLMALADNIKPDRTPEDLLFQVLVDWGVDLTLPITSESIQGKKVFFVDGNALAACFDSNISEDLVKELAKRKPLRAVFRDSSFENDSVKINVEQIFKLLSPETEVKSI